MHVINAEGIGLELPSRRGKDMAVLPVDRVRLWELVPPSPVLHVGILDQFFVIIAETEPAGAPGPAGELPLRLARQADLAQADLAVPFFREPCTELPGIGPGNVRHRMQFPRAGSPRVLPAVFLEPPFKLLQLFVPAISALGRLGLRRVAGFLDKAAELRAIDLQLADVKIVSEGNLGLRFIAVRRPAAVVVFLRHLRLLFRGRANHEGLPLRRYLHEFQFHSLAQIVNEVFELLVELGILGIHDARVCIGGDGDASQGGQHAAAKNPRNGMQTSGHPDAPAGPDFHELARASAGAPTRGGRGGLRGEKSRDSADEGAGEARPGGFCRANFGWRDTHGFSWVHSGACRSAPHCQALSRGPARLHFPSR